MLKRFVVAMPLSALLYLMLSTASAVAENVIDHVRTGGEGVNYQCYAEAPDGTRTHISNHDDYGKATASCDSAKLNTFLSFLVTVGTGEEVLFGSDTRFFSEEVSRTESIIRLTPVAEALLVKYTLPQNSPDSTCGAVRTTEHPDGQCPLSGGSACTTITCIDVGDSDSSINQGTPATLDFLAEFSANSTNTFNPAFAYVTESDTGDIQDKVLIPASFTGEVNSFTSAGARISESDADASYFAHCWCPDFGAVRFTTGTPASNTTQVGSSGSCYGKYLTLTYDQSATELACFESSNDTDWIQIGTAVTKTLACTTDTCLSGAFATSNSLGNTTFADVEFSSDATLTVPGEGGAEPDPNPQGRIWSGDYRNGNYLQWHTASDDTRVTFFQMPEYGRPIQYGGQPSAHVGNGDLAELCHVTGGNIGGIVYEQCPFTPPGISDFANKVTVKNSAEGTESDDCDVPFPTCKRRRTELTVQTTLPIFYDALCYLCERWISFSVYVPSNWSDSGSGWGPGVFQIKPINEGGLSSMLFFEIDNGTWKIHHNWSEFENVSSYPGGEYPWQHSMFYAGNYQGACYPRSSDWPDGLAHFPSEAASCAALQSLNKGGLTHFAMHIKFDARGDAAGGGGFLRIYKSEDDGPWVQVLDIFPGEVTRGGETFDHGVGHPKPPTSSNNGGFGIKAGMYGDKGQFWNQSSSRVLYNANINVADENATCADVTHDGKDCTE